MPYISTERVAEIRRTLKAKYPDVKFSVRKHHWSTVDIGIMAGPYDFGDNRQLNHFYLDRYPHSGFLQNVYEVANEGNRIVSEDGDYGSIPAFYVNIEIGRWNKPYTQTSLTGLTPGGGNG